MALIQWKQISPHLSGSANLTGSLNVSGSILVNGVEVAGGSYAQLTGDNVFTGNQIITGSLQTEGGDVTFNNYPWPQPDQDIHFLQTEPFTLEISGSPDRPYEYMALAFQHREFGYESLYHHAFTVYAYDSHETQAYGSELNISPIRNHMRIYPSGSLSAGNVSIADLNDGRAQALLYADTIEIGVAIGNDIAIGNPSASVNITGSIGFLGDVNIEGTLTAREYHTELVSASIVYQSGSTLFGNSSDDSHTFTGTIRPTGSIIPQVDTTGVGKWNLGSVTNPWQDLYVSTGSIYFVQDGQVVQSFTANTLANTATFFNITGSNGVTATTASNSVTFTLDTGSAHFTNALAALNYAGIFKQSGSFFATTNDLQITGSLSLQSNGTTSPLLIQSESNSLVEVTQDGILVLHSQSIDASAIAGGIIFSNDGNFYFGL